MMEQVLGHSPSWIVTFKYGTAYVELVYDNCIDEILDESNGVLK